MSNHFLIAFIKSAQTTYATSTHKDILARQTMFTDRTKYQIPASIPKNCNVEISYLDLGVRATFRKGQWISPWKNEGTLENQPMKKRVFKNIDLNDDNQLEMLNNYYVVVQERSLESRWHGRELVNGTKGISVVSDRKDPSKGILNLSFEFSLFYHSPTNDDYENMKRTSIRISFPVDKRIND